MQHVANSTAALTFPCTITTMALQAGVQVDDDEVLAYPDDPLINAVLHYVFRRAPQPPQLPAAEAPHQEAEAPSPPPPEPEPAPAAAAAGLRHRERESSRLALDPNHNFIAFCSFSAIEF